MTSEQMRQRSDLLGTQVITRDTGKKLGVVSQLWVDIDRQEVVALTLRPNLLYGQQQLMRLDSISQIGDVILVEDENVIEDLDPEDYSGLINYEVITENGELLGKVRGFKFDVEDGKLASLVIASVGFPLIPDQVVSTYELPVGEIVSSGPDRLIVYEDAIDRLNQLTVGVLERLGVGKPPWERDEDEEYYPMPTRTENQLGTGTRMPMAQPLKREPVVEETWDDDNWGEPAPKPLRQQQRQVEPYYEDEEEDNWSEASGRDSYRKYAAEEVEYQEAAYEDLEEDAWADEEARQPYKAPRVNIPEKTKAPEYEEEGY